MRIDCNKTSRSALITPDTLKHTLNMALTITSGKDSFTLSAEELQNHPGSLLHSLVASVDSSKDGPDATIQVDNLPDSPFATWAPSIQATVALYK